MLSVSITAYREMSERQLCGQRLLDSIFSASNHPAVGEIVVVDDGSSPSDFSRLESIVGGIEKVRLFHNETRLGVFANKIESVARATGEWTILLDSDNTLGSRYVDVVTEAEKDPDVWYLPSVASPGFDFRHCIGTYSLKTLGSIFRTPIGHAAPNMGNHVVNRNAFMDVLGKYRGIRRFDLMLPNYMHLSDGKRTSEQWFSAHCGVDALLLCIEWLSAGKRLAFVDGLEYNHFMDAAVPGSYALAADEKYILSDALVEFIRSKGQVT